MRSGIVQLHPCPLCAEPQEQEARRGQACSANSTLRPSDSTTSPRLKSDYLGGCGMQRSRMQLCVVSCS